MSQIPYELPVLPRLESFHTPIPESASPMRPMGINDSSIAIHYSATDLSEGHDGTDSAVPRAQAVLVIAVVSSMQLMNSILNGILTVGLPSIAQDLGLGDSLLLW